MGSLTNLYTSLNYYILSYGNRNVTETRILAKFEAG